MTCSERFLNMEGQILPPITNYEYEDNLSIRGINDRYFRFEDVSSESEYLFIDRVRNGYLESGVFPTGTGILNLRLTGVFATGITNWAVSGATGYLIPQSGVDLSGLPVVTGSVMTRSIYEGYSVALVNYDTTGSYLIQTGISLTTGARHQFFAQIQQPYAYGNITKNVSVHIIGYTGGIPIAYYDHVSGSWYNNTTPPNTTATQTPTGLRFEFYTTSFPGATPTSYAVRIALTGAATKSTTGNPMIVLADDIHVDEYLARDAFTDVIVPTGYLIQITPDLGWHDTLSMFGERNNEINPHLTTLGPYTVEQENLIDNTDGSITAFLSEDEMQKATNENFRSYLWRAIALGPNTIGEGGLPRRFTYVGKIFDSEFTINKVEDSESIIKVITGTKGQRMSVLVDEEANHPGLEYPTANSWKLTILMDVEYKKLAIRGQDQGGGVTSVRYLELKSNAVSVSERPLWNIFDDFAALLDIQRLPDEDNYKLIDRVKDAVNNPGAPYYEGVLNSSTRELGIKKESAGITLGISKNYIPYNLRAVAVVTSIGVLLRTDDLITTELVYLDPITLKATVSYPIYDNPIIIESEYGEKIDDNDIDFYGVDSENPDLYSIKIADEKTAGKLLKITYPYFRLYKYIDYPYLGQLLLAINQFTDSLNREVITATIDPQLSGSENSDGLLLGEYPITVDSSVDIAWAAIVLRRISDRLFRDSYKDDNENLRKTRFYSFIKELKSNTNIEWGSLRSDRAYWDAANNKDLGFDHLETRCDPSIVQYTSNDIILDSIHAHGRGLSGYSGEKIDNTILNYNSFIPGVAHTFDLEPSVYITQSKAPILSQVFSIVVGETGNSSLKYFTGNII